ncbi:deoxycytidylate deaminase [Bradyrhizobium sp. SZCCHNR3118]|uniref:deoxycytidylate deaminase n=1 Tax=Bradyrhizobium sp. SZCCHNR3118 TaxID=3057468 RepID=UPI0029163327|nr:deaminase [Bradyrhizobium sp. SZCCHNR3118]
MNMVATVETRRPQAWWDRFFIRGAEWISTASKDPSTKVGAVIVRPDRTVASVGYNGFPRKIAHTPERLTDREVKYGLVQHAEENAIDYAREQLDGYTIYRWPFLSCKKCALRIINKGMSRVVAPLVNNPRWADSFKAAQDLYTEAGVTCDLIDLSEEIEAPGYTQYTGFRP